MLKHSSNFKHSIFKLGVDYKDFDLPNFKILVKKKGINFYFEGKNTHINKRTAVEAF